jgi:hypothetical protein
VLCKQTGGLQVHTNKTVMIKQPSYLRYKVERSELLKYPYTIRDTLQNRLLRQGKQPNVVIMVFDTENEAYRYILSMDD